MNPYLVVYWETFQFCLLTAPDTLCPLETTTVRMAGQAAARTGLSCLRSFKADVFWLTVENEVRPHLLTDLLGVCASRQPPDQNREGTTVSDSPKVHMNIRLSSGLSSTHARPGLSQQNHCFSTKDYKWLWVTPQGGLKNGTYCNLLLISLSHICGEGKKGRQMKTSPLDQWPGTLKSGAAES